MAAVQMNVQKLDRVEKELEEIRERARSASRKEAEWEEGQERRRSEVLAKRERNEAEAEILSQISMAWWCMGLQGEVRVQGAPYQDSRRDGV